MKLTRTVVLLICGGLSALACRESAMDSDTADGGPDATTIHDASSDPVDDAVDAAATCPPFKLLPTTSGGGRYITVNAGNSIVDSMTGETLLAAVDPIPEAPPDAGPPIITSAAIDDRALVFMVAQGGDGYWDPARKYELRAMTLDGRTIRTLEREDGWVHTGDNFNHYPLRKLALHGHEVYYSRPAASPRDAAAPPRELVARDPLGTGAIRSIAPLENDLSDVAFADGTIYYIDEADRDALNTIWKTASAGGGALETFIRARNLGELQVHGDFAYWIETENRFAGSTPRPYRSTVRMRALNAGDPRTFIDWTHPISNLGATNQRFYWLEIPQKNPTNQTVLQWSIQSIPILGAAGDKKSIAAQYRTPTASWDFRYPDVFAARSFFAWTEPLFPDSGTLPPLLHVVCEQDGATP